MTPSFLANVASNLSPAQIPTMMKLYTEIGPLVRGMGLPEQRRMALLVLKTLWITERIPEVARPKVDAIMRALAVPDGPSIESILTTSAQQPELVQVVFDAVKTFASPASAAEQMVECPVCLSVMPKQALIPR